MSYSVPEMNSRRADIPTLDPQPGGRPHIPALDGLRGLAILLVLLVHFAPLDLASKSLFRRLVLRIAAAGWTGVDLFFVLSGFLITGILLDARSKPHYFRNFYARRTLRIFPLYYGTLAAIFLIAPFMRQSHDPGWRQIVHSQGLLWTYLWNFHMARAGMTGATAYQPFFVSPFWSLAVEEHFYLVWPAIVLVLSQRKLLVTACATVAVVLCLRIWAWHAGFPDVAIYVATPFRLDGFACGAILAVLARRDGGLGRLVRPATAIALISGLLIMVGMAKGWDNETPAVFTFGFTLIAIFFSSLLVLVVTASPASVLGHVFASRPMRFLGKYSYGLYIFHAVLLPVFWRHFTPNHLLPYMHCSYMTAVGLQILLSAGVSFALAWVSYNCYEKHFLNLKRFFPE
jgi:peptidoglycan/LPS O-acetylase OafA/YrhL